MKTFKEMTDGERVQAFLKAKDDYPYFVEQMFSESSEILKEGVWCGGEYINDITNWLQNNPKTIRVSAKDHFKSMSFYSHIMWKILRMSFIERSREIQYFSYKQSMSNYHIGKIKTAVQCNPWFNGVLDLKKEADGIIAYTWDTKIEDRHVLTVSPKGLLEFKRGIHCPDVYVDDPLQDPENKMVPTKITRINDIIKNQILDMAQEELHIVGTAQTNHDFFFDKNLTGRFSVRILPAVVDKQNRIALWPEWMDFDELEAKRKERGDKVFSQEYLVKPVYSANSFFEENRLRSIINKDLRNYSINDWEKEVEKNPKKHSETDRVGGWDLGKKQHPAYFTWFEKIDGKRIQRHIKWFDGEDYNDQLEYITEVVERCGLYKVFYDSTRGELEMLSETGELPGEFEGVHFTFKAKNAMGTAWDKSITNKTIELINEERSINQILIVNNELQAPETPEGHGDSFWGVALTFRDSELEVADLTFV